MTEPDKYVGKTFRIDELYYAVKDEKVGTYYHYCIIIVFGNILSLLYYKRCTDLLFSRAGVCLGGWNTCISG